MRLAAGDSVFNRHRLAPYQGKWVICRAGTESDPIVLRGIPDGSGYLPVHRRCAC